MNSLWEKLQLVTRMRNVYPYWGLPVGPRDMHHTVHRLRLLLGVGSSWVSMYYTKRIQKYLWKSKLCPRMIVWVMRVDKTLTFTRKGLIHRMEKLTIYITGLVGIILKGIMFLMAHSHTLTIRISY